MCNQPFIDPTPIEWPYYTDTFTTFHTYSYTLSPPIKGVSYTICNQSHMYTLVIKQRIKPTLRSIAFDIVHFQT